MARKLYLSNDWDVHRTEVTSRGVLVTGISPRGLISLTPNGTAIHASLEVVLAELAPGDFIGTIQGTDLTTHLLALWDAAQLTTGRLIVYERVIVDTQDYGDVEQLVVERDRPARRSA